MGKSEEVKKAPADKKEKRELLEFTLGENRYGVDIGVVSEIRQYQVPTRVPNVQPYVEGVFILLRLLNLNFINIHTVRYT